MSACGRFVGASPEAEVTETYNRLVRWITAARDGDDP